MYTWAHYDRFMLIWLSEFLIVEQLIVPSSGVKIFAMTFTSQWRAWPLAHMMGHIRIPVLCVLGGP